MNDLEYTMFVWFAVWFSAVMGCCIVALLWEVWDRCIEWLEHRQQQRYKPWR